MLVFATSSSKALSRKTIGVSPAGRELLVPGDDPVRERLDVAARDFRGETGDQDARRRSECTAFPRSPRCRSERTDRDRA